MLEVITNHIKRTLISLAGIIILYLIISGGYKKCATNCGLDVACYEDVAMPCLKAYVWGIVQFILFAVIIAGVVYFVLRDKL